MTEKIKNIIIPVDFSDKSEISIENAIHISKLIHCKIHLVNVIEFIDWWNNLVVNSEVREKITELSKQNLKKITDSHPDVHFELVVLFGRKYEQILNYAESIKANFIILHDKHKDEDDKKIVGSTVTHVITKSKCPVITIKNKKINEIKHIIVPIDLSDDTELQMLSAIEFNKYTNAHLHFVSVLFKGYGTRNIRIKSKAQRLKNIIKEYKIPFSINLIKKQNVYAYQDILEFSDKQNADLIIIMTHKENYSFDNYIGAFAHQIINFSKAPVMTITSQAAHSEKETIITKFIDPLGIFDKNKQE